MTGEILTRSAIESFYLKDELNMMVIAALWSGNTPLHQWTKGFIGASEKLARDEDFMIKLDELSDAVARFKFAESLFTQEKDYAEQVAELLKNDPTLYLVPTKFQRKRPFPKAIINSPSDPKNFIPEPLKTTILRKELASYAIATNQGPKFLDRDIERLKPFLKKQKETPPFLDDKLPYHSNELDVAIKTWLHFFDEGNYRQNQATIPQIKEYLDQNRKKLGELSNNAIKRISTMINPNKKGGAPKSGN